MIVLKSTYNKLFELFSKEKHQCFDIYNEKLALMSKNRELLGENRKLKDRLKALKELVDGHN